MTLQSEPVGGPALIAMLQQTLSATSAAQLNCAYADRLVVPDPLLHDSLHVRIAISKLICTVFS